MRLLKTVTLVLSLATLTVACSSSGKLREDASADAGAALRRGGTEIGKYGSGSDGAYELGASSGAYGAGGADPDAGGPLSKRTIYFQYDSSEVDPEYLPVINQQAGYLTTNRSKSVVLEGHADERGSPEYNIGLGEQRAKTVAKLLKLQGVNDGQIQIVSFGEEKAAVYGSGESVWQKNRRVEITYP